MRSVFNITALLFIAGCSVQPLYTGTEASSPMPVIRMIPGRSGQILHAELCRLFKTFPHNLSRYIVRISLDRQQYPMAYDKHGIANRLDVRYTAEVMLSDPAESKLVLQDKVTVNQGNSISGSPGEIITSLYVGYEKTLLEMLAEKIFKRLVTRGFNEN